MQPKEIEVYLTDGSSCKVMVPPHMQNGDLIEKVCNKINMPDMFGLGLYELKDGFTYTYLFENEHCIIAKKSILKKAKKRLKFSI